MSVVLGTILVAVVFPATVAVVALIITNIWRKP